jgi:nucleoside 2-deoxyribosyltransferase
MAVYFIRNTNTGAIKIGFSASPQQRLRQLQTGCADPLVIEATLPGDMSRERELHNAFAAHRLNGEWFEGDPVMASLEEMRRSFEGPEISPLAVYFAGKIGRRDWRHSIYSSLDDHRFAAGNEEKRPALIRDGIRYVGPFFQASQHGAAHGASTHGCNFANPYIEARRDEVKPHNDTYERVCDLCLEWLGDADAVFCYIDGPRAYGTAFELGFARAARKPIFLAFGSDDEWCCYPYRRDDEWRDLWLIRQAASVVVSVESIHTAWRLFLGWADGLREEKR